MEILSRTLKSLRRRLWSYPVLPMLVIACLLLMAIFADLIVPHSPVVTNLPDRLIPPFWQDGGSMKYILGTDSLGRDILSRIVMGARISLAVAFSSLAIGGTIGTILGICAGYLGGLVDTVIMRLADAVLGFPLLLLALLLAVTRGASFDNLIIAICIAIWGIYVRVVRSEVVSIKERDFVALAKVAGCSRVWIMFHHIFPNVLNTVVVLLTLQVGFVILVEATLSFLGAGVPPHILPGAL